MAADKKRNWSKELDAADPAKKFYDKNGLDEAVAPNPENIHDRVLRCRAPSVNYCFDNAHGLPRGACVIFWGGPKTNKTLLSLDFVGAMHQSDPEGIAVRYDTEMRTRGQMNPNMLRAMGIDPSRLKTYETNAPEEVYDHIEDELVPRVIEGMPLRLVIIDSINSLRGRRGMNADTVKTMNRGDEALTQQEGLKRILMPIRRLGISMIMTAQERLEQDEKLVEAQKFATGGKQGYNVRMAANFYLKHFGEYFFHFMEDLTKNGRQDLMEKPFLNEDVKDVTGKAQVSAKKVLVVCNGNSYGRPGRTGEFTWSYDNMCLTNTEEEYFLLGKHSGLIGQSGSQYTFGDRKWNGKAGVLKALVEDPAMSAAILKQLVDADLNRNSLQAK